MPDQVTTIITTDKAVANNEMRLSICLRTNGFSFSVVAGERELLTFGEAVFNLHRPVGELTNAVRSFFDAHGIATFECRQVRLVVPSEQCVWVPEHLYDARRDRQYLQTVTTLAGDAGVCHTFSGSVGAYMVFTAPMEVVTAFKVALPGVDVMCQHSVLANEMLMQQSERHPVVLMHVRDGVGDFEAFYNGRLLMSNSYAANGEKELLYHALNVMKTLHLETPDMELAICGEVGRDIYGMLQHYFPNVTLYTGRPFTYTNPDFQTFHSYRHVLVL